MLKNDFTKASNWASRRRSIEIRWQKKKGTSRPVPFNLVLAEIFSSDPRTSSSTVRNYIWTHLIWRVTQIIGFVLISKTLKKRDGDQKRKQRSQGLDIRLPTLAWMLNRDCFTASRSFRPTHTRWHNHRRCCTAKGRLFSDSDGKAWKREVMVIIRHLKPFLRRCINHR